MADAVLYELRLGLAHYYRKTIIEVTSIFNTFELIHISRKKVKSRRTVNIPGDL